MSEREPYHQCHEDQHQHTAQVGMPEVFGLTVRVVDDVQDQLLLGNRSVLGQRSEPVPSPLHQKKHSLNTSVSVQTQSREGKGTL